MSKVSKIRKRDGRIVEFKQQKITDAIHKAFIAVREKDGKLAKKVSNVAVKEIEKRFEKKIPSVEDVQDVVIEVLKKKGYDDVAKEYSEYREKKIEIRKLKEEFGIEKEPKLTVNSLEVLRKRYLLRNEKGEIIETPTQMFRRVARAIARVDENYGEDSKKSEEEFYRIMSRLEFLPNSPTLFNADAPLGQLSACFVLPVKDSLESIFTAVKNTALVEQTGGGVGLDFSRLRPKGDIVKSTKGVASGPVSFMHVFDTATEVIKAGGKRRGALMGILRVDHPDILEFITIKGKRNVLTNFNISVAVTDDFMKAVENDEEYELINPRTGRSVRRLRAKHVWNLIVKNAWKCGDPGVIFIDEINRSNPTPELGRIDSTNPCVTGDTFISTENGLKKIKDLHNPEKILGIDGNPHRIAWCGKTGLKEVFKIKTNAGYELEATSDHRFLTSDGVWKPLVNLTKKDKLVLQKEGKFGKLHVDKEIALMLGWLVGDGFITKGMQDVEFIFNKAEKVEMLPVFKEYLDRVNGGPVKPTVRKTEICLKYSSKIARIFYDLGLKPLPPDKKEVPSTVFGMDKESVKLFLSALFGADGSVQGNRKKGVSIRLSSTSLKLLKQVQLLLLQFGIFSKIYENRRLAWGKLPDSRRKLKDYSCKAQHELVISRESMFKFMREIGFCITAKNRKFESIKPRKIYRDNPDLHVKSIIRIGKKEVFDLSEPFTHSFVANGIVTHNCGEQPLLPYESCNLGSINLTRMLNENNEIDWNKLKRTVHTAVHFLDNVIDANKFPLRKIEKMTKSNRKIGLGIMGFAEMLIMMGIPYDSQKAIDLAEKIMKFITEEARKKSVEFGRKRGSFPNFKKSIWYGKYDAMRNATVTTIAPTGTISIIAGCSSGIEPLFAVSFMRNVLGGTKLFEVNPVFEKIAKEKGFYSGPLLEKIARVGSLQGIKEVPKDVRRIFVTALDIKPEWHVKMQAAFQKWTDNAVSKTINLPKTAKVKDVERVYKMAWKLKCKGITVYRYGCKPEQVLYIGEVKKKGKYVQADEEYSGGCMTKVCPG